MIQYKNSHETETTGGIKRVGGKSSAVAKTKALTISSCFNTNLLCQEHLYHNTDWKHSRVMEIVKVNL